MLSGTKHFELFPPEAASTLQPFPYWSALARQSRVEHHLGEHSSADVSAGIVYVSGLHIYLL